MGLTADEQARMDQLQKEVGHLDTTGLTPEENMRMAQLQKEVGHLDQPTLSAAPSYGIPQTALEHGANSLLLNHYPQVVGAAGLLAGKDYTQTRDATINRLAKEQFDNPSTAKQAGFVGSVAGALATPEPEIMAGKGLYNSAARVLGYGAGYGAAQNPGDTPGEVHPFQASERAGNALKGIPMGLLAEAGTAAAGKTLKTLGNAQESLRGTAQDQALHAAGAMTKDLRSIEGQGRTEQIGQYALDRGIVQAGDDVASIAEKAGAAKDKAGKELNDIYGTALNEVNKQQSNAQRGAGYLAENEKQLQVGKHKIPVVHEPSQGINSFIDPSGKPMWAGAEDQLTHLPVGADEQNFFNKGFNPARDRQAIIENARKEMGNQKGREAALADLNTYFDQLEKDYGNKTLDPATANDIKSKMDQEINFKRNPLSKDPASEQAFLSARRSLAKSIDEHIDEIGKLSGNADLAQRLKAANLEYGNSKTLHDLANDYVQRAKGNATVSLTDRMAGGIGAGAAGIAGAAMPADDMSGHAVHGAEGVALGTMAGLLNHGARKYGSGIIASGANQLANPPVIGPYLKYPAMIPTLLGKGINSNTSEKALTNVMTSNKEKKKSQ